MLTQVVEDVLSSLQTFNVPSLVRDPIGEVRSIHTVYMYTSGFPIVRVVMCEK